MSRICSCEEAPPLQLQLGVPRVNQLTGAAASVELKACRGSGNQAFPVGLPWQQPPNPLQHMDTISCKLAVNQLTGATASAGLKACRGSSNQASQVGLPGQQPPNSLQHMDTM
jgi:hypothetical protein